MFIRRCSLYLSPYAQQTVIYTECIIECCVFKKNNEKLHFYSFVLQFHVRHFHILLYFTHCVFMSCKFISCNFGPSFSCASFSVNPRRSKCFVSPVAASSVQLHRARAVYEPHAPISNAARLPQSSPNQTQNCSTAVVVERPKTRNNIRGSVKLKLTENVAVACKLLS